MNLSAIVLVKGFLKRLALSSRNKPIVYDRFQT